MKAFVFIVSILFVAGAFAGDAVAAYAEPGPSSEQGYDLYERAIERYEYERSERLDYHTYYPRFRYYRRYPYDLYQERFFRGHPYYGDVYPYGDRYPLGIRPPYGYRYPYWYRFPYGYRWPYGYPYDYFRGGYDRYYRYPYRYYYHYYYRDYWD